MDSKSIDRIEQLERRLARAERRLRATWSLAFVGTLGAFVLGANPQARAQFGVTLSSLNTRLTAVENKTQDMSRGTDANTGQPTVRFSNVNVQIVSGSGSTSGAINGLGNLIVGYNELRSNGNVRTGSHNLVLGSLQNYGSYAGFVAGVNSTISGPYASVSGGSTNTASNWYASVSGGTGNRASGFSAWVSGGMNNEASGSYSSVSGGRDNGAAGGYSSVSGGIDNTSSGDYSSVLGGSTNTSSGDYSSVSGGRNNNAAGFASSVSGGNNRDILSTGTDDWKAGSYFSDF